MEGNISLKKLLREDNNNLDYLHDGISTSTISGRAWFKLVSDLETMIGETQDFPSQYSASVHGPKPNVSFAIQNLQEIVKLMVTIKPIIRGMDEIEKKDI